MDAADDTVLEDIRSKILQKLHDYIKLLREGIVYGNEVCTCYCHYRL